MGRPVHDERERRIVESSIELRQDEGHGTVEGIAAVFGHETVIGSAPWGFREVIAPEAFGDALQRPDDVRALFNHDPNVVLGRTKSKTLRLTATEEGLRYVVDLPETAAAQDVRALIQRGDVTGSSFGFRVTDDQWTEPEKNSAELPLRTIRSVELFDVSPVTYPAYPQTSVGARAKAESLSGVDVVSGIVPRNISVAVRTDLDWRELRLEDFTEDLWEELTDRERRRIARHYAWSPTATPEAFSDLQLCHHDASDGTAVRAAVIACLDRLHEADIPSADLEKVRTHLLAHRDASDRVIAIDARAARRRQIDEARAWEG